MITWHGFGGGKYSQGHDAPSAGQSAWCCSPGPTSPWASCVCGMQESPCPPLDLSNLPDSDMCSVSMEGSLAVGLMELVSGRKLWWVDLAWQLCDAPRLGCGPRPARVFLHGALYSPHPLEP